MPCPATLCDLNYIIQFVDSHWELGLPCKIEARVGLGARRNQNSPYGALPKAKDKHGATWLPAF